MLVDLQYDLFALSSFTTLKLQHILLFGRIQSSQTGDEYELHVSTPSVESDHDPQIESNHSKFYFLSTVLNTKTKKQKKRPGIVHFNYSIEGKGRQLDGKNK